MSRLLRSWLPPGLALLALSAAPVFSLGQDVFQYRVESPGYVAWLWVPPQAPYLRGLVIAKQNLLDQALVEDSLIRSACAAEKLGIVHILARASGKLLNAFDYTHGAADTVLSALAALAARSGIKEVAHAPFMTIGHSSAKEFAWEPPYWDRSRVFAGFAIKAWIGGGAYDPRASMEGVPFLFLTGQRYEWSVLADHDNPRPAIAECLKKRQTPGNLVAGVVEWGGGHFEWSEADARLLSLFIRKAAQARLPDLPAKDGPVRLLDIQPSQGWLMRPYYDSSGSDEPAPAASFTGKTSEAFWYFDREYADFCRNFTRSEEAKQRQWTAFRIGGKAAPFLPQTAAQDLGNVFDLPIANDGRTFTLGSGFESAIPSPVSGAGTPLGEGTAPTRTRVIVGPFEATGADGLRLRWNRLAHYDRTTWLSAYSTGDSLFAYATNPAQLTVPLLTAGRSQTLKFDSLPDLRADAGPVRLRAVSDAGAPVGFYVLEGPARISDPDSLWLADIPKAGTFPMQVTVVACQWGRTGSSALRAAAPVARTFRVLAPTTALRGVSSRGNRTAARASAPRNMLGRVLWHPGGENHSRSR